MPAGDYPFPCSRLAPAGLWAGWICVSTPRSLLHQISSSFFFSLFSTYPFPPPLFRDLVGPGGEEGGQRNRKQGQVIDATSTLIIGTGTRYTALQTRSLRWLAGWLVGCGLSIFSQLGNGEVGRKARASNLQSPTTLARLLAWAPRYTRIPAPVHG